MKTKYYLHPVTHKTYEVQVCTCTTRQGNTAHLVLVHPVSGGVYVRLVRYSRGEYRKLIGGSLCPVSINAYYPGLNVRGLI